MSYPLPVIKSVWRRIRKPRKGMIHAIKRHYDLQAYLNCERVYPDVIDRIAEGRLRSYVDS